MNFDHTKSEHIRDELSKLKSRWDTFQAQVFESRSHIDLCVQYFTLINEVIIHLNLFQFFFYVYLNVCMVYVISGSRMVPRGQ